MTAVTHSYGAFDFETGINRTYNIVLTANNKIPHYIDYACIYDLGMTLVCVAGDILRDL